MVVANTAEARRSRSGGYYSQPVYAAPVTVYKPVTQSTTASQPVKATTAALSTTTTTAAKTTVSYSTAAATTATTATAAKSTAVKATTVSYSTATAQGVANIMASRGVVGHFGGNPGYEGCGMASTREGAYAICCYANSGMATVDVGYAQGANGMWYCCRRYR
jgi:hypothetical protein